MIISRNAYMREVEVRKTAIWMATGLSIIATTSCAPSTHVQRRIDAKYDGEPRRTLVVYWMQSWQNGMNVAEFHEMLSQRLNRCGISSAYVSKEQRYGKSTPETDGKFVEVADVVDGFQDDSRLLIVEKSATYWRNNGNAFYNKYEVNFIDRNKRAVVWSGDVGLSSANSFRVTPQEKAEALSKDIFSYLIKDGIIRTCPPDVPSAKTSAE